MRHAAWTLLINSPLRHPVPGTLLYLHCRFHLRHVYPVHIGSLNPHVNSSKDTTCGSRAQDGSRGQSFSDQALFSVLVTDSEAPPPTPTGLHGLTPISRRQLRYTFLFILSSIIPFHCPFLIHLLFIFHSGESLTFIGEGGGGQWTSLAINTF